MLLVQRIQVTLTNGVKLDPFKVYRYLVLSVYEVLKKIKMPYYFRNKGKGKAACRKWSSSTSLPIH